MSFLDYNLWQSKGTWFWELVRVTSDGQTEQVLRSGAAKSEDEARKQIGLKPKQAVKP